MSLFKSLFGNPEQESNTKIDWKMLTDVSQIDEVIEASRHNPVLIFKHSTRCGISRMTLKKFESEYNLTDKVTPYFLDLLAHRDVSDAISRQFNVVHQSPQLILVKEGKSVYDASHEAIDANVLGNLISV